MNMIKSNHINLESVAQFVIDEAQKQGADQSEVSLHHGTGVSVSARMGELETVEKHNDSQVVISVYKDHKTGSASSADMSEQGIKDSINAAMSIASYTGADDCFGLADRARMATHFTDLQLHHPWQVEVSDLVGMALQCEQAALQYDQRIVNSEGASINSYSGSNVYANSYGFLHQVTASQYGASCSVIGQAGDSMQRDYWYDNNRNPQQLIGMTQLGQQAAERTVNRLDARKIASCEAPVLFEPSVAKSLVGHVVSGISGGAIYKKASFLLDKVGESILPDFVTIAENPHLLGASGSANYDQEGVATPEYRAIVEHGVLQSYILGSYTARKLKLSSTANAGGVRNVTVSDTGQDAAQMLKQLGTGLLVTELIGSGINMVTGDYSRGAAGFWVENGEIQYPVEEITIAGNLTDMLQNIVAVGRDVDLRGNIRCGSVLLEKMTIAGS